MAVFAYRAIGRDGQGRRGEIQAQSRGEALAQVRRLGVTPLSVDEAKPMAARGATGGVKVRGEVTKALGELGVLTNAGLPLDRALALCLENIDHPVVRAEFVRMLGDMREGASLSRSMAAQPGLFPANARAMVEAGEANGRLGDALTRVERMFNQAEEIRRLVVGAMIYPAALALLALAVILLMLLYVLPQFESLLSTTRGTLPTSSLVLLAASRFLRTHGLMLALGVLVAVIAIRQALQQPRTKRALDRFCLPCRRSARSFASWKRRAWRGPWVASSKAAWPFPMRWPCRRGRSAIRRSPKRSARSRTRSRKAARSPRALPRPVRCRASPSASSGRARRPRSSA